MEKVKLSSLELLRRSFLSCDGDLVWVIISLSKACNYVKVTVCLNSSLSIKPSDFRSISSNMSDDKSKSSDLLNFSIIERNSSRFMYPSRSLSL